MIAPGFTRLLMMGIMLVTCWPLPSLAYGLLTHEAIVDATWQKTIQPLLKKKYPGATEDQLKTAHAFVYGGAIIPDIGYCPFCKPLFSNLVHYVRSGDFVNALLAEAHDLNEYAFALGVLCHYEADSYGHPFGTNKAVPILFPRLKNKYGKLVTFEEGHIQHSRVEFGFDVLQTARGNYASNAYHNFIGFQVSDSVLERAFFKTYGMSLKDVFQSFSTAIAIFRFSVKTLLPELTKDAWKIKNSFITQLNPLANDKNYQYKMNKKNYRKEFLQPKVQSFLLSLIVGILPKYGSLSKFKPKIPNPEAEKLFEQSFDSTLEHYSASVKRLSSKDVACKNIDWDTGKETIIGEYKLADQAYYKLLRKLSRNKFVDTDKELKRTLTTYYSKRNPSVIYATQSHYSKKIKRILEKLNTTQANLGT